MRSESTHLMSNQFLSMKMDFATKKMTKLIQNMEAAKRGEALQAAAVVIDRYVYSNLAPQVVALTPIDTSALATSLSSPDAPGALYEGTITNDRFDLVYGTTMDSEMRYQYYGGGKTGAGPSGQPYFYPDEIEQEHGMLQHGTQVWREILHVSALGNITKAIMRVLRR